MEPQQEYPDKHTLTVIQTIKAVILKELGRLIYPANKNKSDVFEQSSPYIKFMPLVGCIEFLGACYDEQPFDSTRGDVKDIVERRFNKAIKELFPKSYHPFAKANHKFYLYGKLRCPLIHQLKPGPGIYFTTRFESKQDNTEHLKEFETGKLILVLEDFYDDLEKASLDLINKFETKKITNKKGESGFLDIIKIKKEDKNVTKSRTA